MLRSHLQNQPTFYLPSHLQIHLLLHLYPAFLSKGTQSGLHHFSLSFILTKTPTGEGKADPKVTQQASTAD